MTVRDQDIRCVLKARLRAMHGDQAETRIFDELAICQARARADIAVVNGHLAGFEIKSGADRLDRLPQQVRYYGQVFDYACVVAASRYVETLLRRLPDWWGVWVAEAAEDSVMLSTVRASRPNPDPNINARAALLWRDEMSRILSAHGAPPAIARLPRRTLLARLVDYLDEDILANEVRAALRARTSRESVGSSFAGYRRRIS